MLTVMFLSLSLLRVYTFFLPSFPSSSLLLRLSFLSVCMAPSSAFLSYLRDGGTRLLTPAFHPETSTLNEDPSCEAGGEGTCVHEWDVIKYTFLFLRFPFSTHPCILYSLSPIVCPTPLPNPPTLRPSSCSFSLALIPRILQGEHF